MHGLSTGARCHVRSAMSLFLLAVSRKSRVRGDWVTGRREQRAPSLSSHGGDSCSPVMVCPAFHAESVRT